MFDDPYDVLGIEPSATSAEIRAAYRKKAKTMHPDAGGGVEAFKDLGAAQRILLDPDLRARFDATGSLDEADDSMMNDERDAMDVIAQVLELAMQQDGIERTDVVLGITRTIDSRIAALRLQIAEHKNQISTLKRMGKRFRREKRGANLIRKMFEARATNHTQTVAVLERQLVAHRRAIELMDGYEFDREMPQPAYDPMTLRIAGLGTSTRP